MSDRIGEESFDTMLCLGLSRGENYSSRGQNASDIVAKDTGDKNIETIGSSGRKKLKLTHEQFALLEETFQRQSNINQAQKEALARQLNLVPRQVDVWFQNRRARAKAKQTEGNYELLKKHCESLTAENIRLKQEIQDLRSFGHIQFPSTTSVRAVCPSCDPKVERADNKIM